MVHSESKGEINAPVKYLLKFPDGKLFDMKEHTDCRHQTAIPFGYTFIITVKLCLSL